MHAVSLSLGFFVLIRMCSVAVVLAIFILFVCMFVLLHFIHYDCLASVFFSYFIRDFI